MISLFFSLKRRAKVLRLPQTHKKNKEKTEFVSKNNAWFLQSLLFKGVFPKLNLFHHAELRGCTFMQGSPSSLLYVRHIHFIMYGTSISSCMAHPFLYEWRIHYIMTSTFKIFSKFQKYFCNLQNIFSNFQNFFWNLQNILFIPVAHICFTHSSLNDSSSYHHVMPSFFHSFIPVRVKVEKVKKNVVE